MEVARIASPKTCAILWVVKAVALCPGDHLIYSVRTRLIENKGTTLIFHAPHRAELPKRCLVALRSARTAEDEDGRLRQRRRPRGKIGIPTG
jgi:hypothetical protein